VTGATWSPRALLKQTQPQAASTTVSASTVKVSPTTFTRTYLAGVIEHFHIKRLVIQRQLIMFHGLVISSQASIGSTGARGGKSAGVHILTLQVTLTPRSAAARARATPMIAARNFRAAGAASFNTGALSPTSTSPFLHRDCL
jgi:hypothetical protein